MMGTLKMVVGDVVGLGPDAASVVRRVFGRQHLRVVAEVWLRQDTMTN